MKICLTLSFLFWCLPGNQEGITINLKTNTKNEQEAKAQLERIMRDYDLSKWFFTKTVLIDDNDFIPHSHPVLTLNSRYLNDDRKQLANFVHEQTHWWEEGNEKKIERAIKEFQTLYPKVPVGKNGGGARDTYSTYLHLIICYHEFRIMASLIGEAEAEKLLREWQHYTWIYDKVLNDPIVKKVIETHDLQLVNE